MPTLVASSSIATQYEISNSLRFNDGDSAKLSRTPSSAGNRQTWTISVWVKRSTLTTGQGIFSTYSGNANINTQSAFQSNDKLNFYDATSAYQWRFVTNQLFRDPSAWYNLCYVSDTTQSTAGDRIKLYINGSRVTDFEVALNPDQNNNTADWNADVLHNIGEHNGEFFDGYMAEFHNIDGQALTPSDFGETDDNGVWIPKAYTGSYGTNGFYLEFKQTGTGTDANGIGADTSGNDNHFAVTNLAATDVTTDTPTNNFAILLPVYGVDTQEGNLKISHGRNYWDGIYASIGLTTGKWYWEHKIDDVDGDNRRVIGGIVSNPETYPHMYDGKGTTSDPTGSGTYGTVSSASPSYMYTGWATNYIFDGTSTYQSTWVDLDDNDVLGFALDLDNNKFFMAVNGTYIAADGGSDGNPATGANETFDIAAASNSRVYFPAAVLGWSSNTSSTTLSWNFGNPSFAISSGNADASGYGDFEYAVPSGFYAICTKNLAEFG